MSFKPCYNKLAKTWSVCRYLETQLIALELTKCHVRHSVVGHRYEHSTRWDIFPQLCGLQVSTQNTGQILLEFVCLWVLASPSCHLNSDSVTEHRCWTFTEMGISEENGNCMRKLWIKEKMHTSRPGFLISLQVYQKTLCPICCFPPVDLVFVFTQLDSTSVSQKKKHFDKTGLLKY